MSYSGAAAVCDGKKLTETDGHQTTTLWAASEPLYPLFHNTKCLWQPHPATPSLTLTPQFNIYKADL